MNKSVTLVLLCGLVGTPLRAQELGIGVTTWTVADEPEIARLADVGVHAIVTDVPDVARRVLGGP